MFFAGIIWGLVALGTIVGYALLTKSLKHDQYLTCLEASGSEEWCYRNVWGE